MSSDKYRVRPNEIILFYASLLIGIGCRLLTVLTGHSEFSLFGSGVAFGAFAAFVICGFKRS